MMGTLNLLYKKEFVINNFIKIQIPTIGEILEHEDEYCELVSLLTSTPVDLLVQLDDAGIDFSSISEYQLFLLLFPSLKERDTKLIFGDLDLKLFSTAVNEQNGNIILIDTKTGARIDRAIQERIANALRKIHHIKKNVRQPANKAAKEFMLKRGRDKMRRHRTRVIGSQLEELIVAMVNTEQFGYRYEEVPKLTIYQFGESIQQVTRKVDYDNTMRGVYAGTINVKDLSQEEFNWLTHK